MSATLLETIQTLQYQAERLEQEASELRQALANVAEVENVRTELAKPWTESALYELTAVKKVAKKLRERSPEAQDQYFFKTVEAIRPSTKA